MSGSLQEGDGDADAIDCRNSGDVASLDSIAPGEEVRKIDARRCSATWFCSGEVYGRRWQDAG